MNGRGPFGYRIVTIVTATLILVLLAACGGSPSTVAGTGRPAASVLVPAVTAITPAPTLGAGDNRDTPSVVIRSASPAPIARIAPPAPMVGLPDDLDDAVVALLAAYERRGVTRAGIIVKDAATGEALRLEPDALFPSASLYKPFLLWAVQDAIGAGDLRDDTRLTLTAATDDSAEDGYRLGAYGDTITVTEARRLMIAASNNTAAWLLVEAIGGWAKIEIPLRDHGFHATTTYPDLATTPRDVTRFFEGIVNETLDPDLDAADYALMRGLFADASIPAYLSAGLAADATFAHKTANLVGVLHDAGVLTLADGRVVYVTVLTEGDYQAGQAFLRDLALTLTLALGG